MIVKLHWILWLVYRQLIHLLQLLLSLHFWVILLFAFHFLQFLDQSSSKAQFSDGSKKLLLFLLREVVTKDPNIAFHLFVRVPFRKVKTQVELLLWTIIPDPIIFLLFINLHFVQVLFLNLLCPRRFTILLLL